jgi:undecaprenyl-diphosphatase
VTGRPGPLDRSRWAAGRAVGEAIRRLHGAWKALPSQATRRWWLGLLAGQVLVLALTGLLVWFAMRLEQTGALAAEASVLRWIDQNSPLSFSTAIWIDAFGNGFVLYPLMLFCAGLAAWRGRALLSVTLITGYTLVYGPILFGWWLWDRARPDLIAGGLAAPGSFNSYPSGHMIQSLFAWGLLCFLWMRASSRAGERFLAAALFLGLIAAIALARLRLGAHWPSDILAGVVIGGAWLGMGIGALHFSERRVHPRAAVALQQNDTPDRKRRVG